MPTSGVRFKRQLGYILLSVMRQHSNNNDFQFFSLIKQQPRVPARIAVIAMPITVIQSVSYIIGIMDAAAAMPETAMIAILSPLLGLNMRITASTRRTQVSTAVMNGPTFA